MSHNFDTAEWEAKQRARAELSEPHAEINSVKAVSERLKKIEWLLNIKPNET